MRIGITGTPGTGKSTVGEMLSKKLSLPLYSLSPLIKEKGLFKSYDSRRKAYEVDAEKLKEFFKGKDNFIVEGLVAHYIPLDYLIILRASPEEIKRRLKPRNYPREKVLENAEAEKLAVIATEAFKEPKFKKVIHVDTTGRSPEEVAQLIERLIKEGKELLEDVDWLEGEGISY